MKSPTIFAVSNICIPFSKFSFKKTIKFSILKISLHLSYFLKRQIVIFNGIVDGIKPIGITLRFRSIVRLPCVVACRFALGKLERFHDKGYRVLLLPFPVGVFILRSFALKDDFRTLLNKFIHCFRRFSESRNIEKARFLLISISAFDRNGGSSYRKRICGLRVSEFNISCRSTDKNTFIHFCLSLFLLKYSFFR
nr:MAG TPA: hypothetical protein [Caudoviricetes sp.]